MEIEDFYLDPKETEAALPQSQITTEKTNGLNELTKKDPFVIKGEPPFQRFLCHLT